MLPRFIAGLPSLRKMDRADCFAAIAILQVLRQQRFDRFGFELLQKPINDAPQHSLRKALRRRINRRDTPQVDRFLFVIFDHFKLGMIHAKALAAKLRLPENHQLLTGGDHFLDVMQIEPATDQRLTQRVRVRFLQCGFEDFFPAAESAQRGFDYFAGQTNRRVAFFAREPRKLMSIFVTPRKVR